jgi:MFS family permease
MSFGVFQNYYSQMPGLARSNVALIGTTAQGLYFLGAPLSATITKQYPRYQRQQIWISWPLCIIGLLAASFSSTLGGLVATQGVIYGVGFVMLSYPIVSMLNEWWIARKGMAFGLLSASSGVTGVAMPFIIEAMLRKYGHRTTLRASAVAMVVLTGPLIPLLEGRLPPSEQSTMSRTNWSFLKKPLFWVFCMSTMVQGLAFFIPPVFLPSYAADIGLSSTQGALLLALMSAAQVLGQFAFGYLSDNRFPVSALVLICLIFSAGATFIFWGLSKSLPMLGVFSVIYGIFAYGFGTMRVAMGMAVSDDQSSVVATYAILVFLQGIGNVLVSPISASLISNGIALDEFGASSYKWLIFFTGGCMVLSALVVGLQYLGVSFRRYGRRSW